MSEKQSTCCSVELCPVGDELICRRCGAVLENTRAAHTAVEVLDLLVDWLKASPFDKIQIANVVKKIAALRAEKGV